MTVKYYRPEIDGLRAIAILSVIFYHAGFKTFSGGFAGVDIFFVISGFLIARSILTQLQQNRFSILDFWQRRIGRILPALSVMVLAVITVGSLIYFPEDYKNVAKQAAFQSILAPNLYFLNQTGYFNADTATKPLLHTWSLGVEMQFYLLAPLLFVWAWKSKRQYLLPIVAGITALSFLFSLYAAARFPNAAFYLLPFRAWELLIGTLVALLPTCRFKGKLHDVSGALALLLIFASIFTFKPGAIMLLPCLGAALFIWSNGSHLNIAGKILSYKMPVFIGVISYSLYLWHWPIMSMSEYIPLIPKETPFKFFLIGCSFVAAFLSWEYVEGVFNRRIRIARHGFAYAGMASLLIVMGIAGSTAFLYAKFKPVGKMDVAAMERDINPHRKQCQHKDDMRFKNEDICQTNAASGLKPSFFMLGDSHGNANAPLFYSLSQQANDNGYIAFKHGCPPVINFSRSEWSKSDNENCHRYVNAALNYITEKNIRTVFLIAQWDIWLKNKADIDGFQETLDRLRQKNSRIYVLMPPPKMDFHVPRMMGFQEKFGLREVAYIPREKYLKTRPIQISSFIAQNQDVIFLDPQDLFCPDDKCPAQENGHALYYDSNHLSSYGVQKLSPLFVPAFEKPEIIRRRAGPLLTFVLSRPPSGSGQKL